MTKYFNLDNPAPYLSSRSWVMMNLNTGEVMYAKQENEKRQVASLTKIVTTLVILDFMSRYGLDSRKVTVNILGCCVTHRLGGTSADLLEGDTLTVYELLHGMMLPSGNDAAQALAIYFGHMQILIKT